MKSMGLCLHLAREEEKEHSSIIVSEAVDLLWYLDADERKGCCPDMWKWPGI